MNSGEMDRRITIKTPTETKNDEGDVTVTWSNFARPWAKVIHLRGQELFAARQIVPNAELKIRIYWRDGITEKMRVEHDGVEYGIQHIAEIGRRKRIELILSRPE